MTRQEPVEEERRQARRQVTTLGFLLSAVLGAVIWAKHAPADAAELRILVGELRSQAAELATLTEEEAAGTIGEAFVREHARQLAKINTTSFLELAHLRVEQELEVEKSRSLTAGRELRTQLRAIELGRPVASQTQLRKICQTLNNRESALRR
jgi:hypothetical protein